MAEDMKPEAATPWYFKVKTLLITAGALAAAIASVIGLWNLVRDPDVNDEAKITAVRVVKPMMLFDFETAQLGGDVTLQPDPDPDEASGSPTRIALTQYVVTTDSASLRPPMQHETFPTPTPTVVATETPTPTGEPTETPTPTGEPTETPTPTGEPTETPTPTGEPAETPTPTGEPTITPTPTPLSQSLRDALAQAIAEDPRTANTGLRGSDFIGLLPPSLFILIPDPGTPADPSDKHTAKEVVDELLKTLDGVEGDPGNLNRRGWLVTVELEVAGYRGEQMMLTYSLDPIGGGEEVPDSWSAARLGYYLTPTTQHDTGVVDIWIPDLKEPGPYVVNVDLIAVNEALKIAQGQSPPIE